MVAAEHIRARHGSLDVMKCRLWMSEPRRGLGWGGVCRQSRGVRVVCWKNLDVSVVNVGSVIGILSSGCQRAAVATLLPM